MTAKNIYLSASQVRKGDVLYKPSGEYHVLSIYVTRPGTVAICVDMRPWEFRHRPETEVLVRREDP